MEDIKKLVNEVLDKGYLMSLATADGEVPWVSDVIYVHDGKLNIYWLSEVDTRHSKSILKNSKTAATITLSGKAEPNIGIQIEGDTQKVEGDVFEMAVQHRLKRNKPAPEKEGEILGPTESWYVLKPKKIQLIYEPLFGFSKKDLFI